MLTMLVRRLQMELDSAWDFVTGVTHSCGGVELQEQRLHSAAGPAVPIAASEGGPLVGYLPSPECESQCHLQAEAFACMLAAPWT